MAVISFGDSDERTWGGAGWAFRQILRDLSAQIQGDDQLSATLHDAVHTGSLVVDILDADLADRIAHSIETMCRGILDGTTPSSISQFHHDRETQDLYRREIALLMSAARGSGSDA